LHARVSKAVTIQFLDANVIIRYSTGDNKEQAERAYQFLAQVRDGVIEVTTCEAVIVEVVYVLSSKTLYNASRQQIHDHLQPILALKGLRLPHKRTYVRALDLYASSNLDFTDALIVAHMERTGISTVVSFDRHFDRIPGIARAEP
jgi:predicted nucleic acid-binding protein